MRSIFSFLYELFCEHLNIQQLSVVRH